MTEIERFAEKYRLRLRRDEAGDPIIPGRRGHLWWDAQGLCLMIVDGTPVSSRRLKDLVGPSGKVWLGTITVDDHGRRVQDVEVRGILPERYREAIKIAGCKARKRHPGPSPEVRARALAAKRRAASATGPSFAPESNGTGREGVNHYPGQDEAVLGPNDALYPHQVPPAGAGGNLATERRFEP